MTRATFRFTLAMALLTMPLHAQRARCGTPDRAPFDAAAGYALAAADCGYWENTPQPEYDPGPVFDIPVVFHVIMNSQGDGFLDAATLQDQIDILNEDFGALPGSPGAPGTDSGIRFHLASVDPGGSATSGITYTTNNSWYGDSGNYWSPLAWDTNRYLNIYTNAPPCCYGYVPDFASAGGLVGQDHDRVVLWWEAVGRDGTPGWPLNMGRTATHEVGHYLGLYHTFDSGCGSQSDCDTTGDLICDTNRQADATLGCPSNPTSCGSSDPFHNYMDYTDDPCLWEFTPEQANRMRCTLQFWRPDLTPTSISAAAEALRAGSPANPMAFLPGSTSGPVTGAVWDPVVDHSSFHPAADTDWLLLSLVPTNTFLAGKGTLLCGPPYFLIWPGPAGAPITLPIPDDPALVQLGFCAQVASKVTGGGPYQFTNAIDCTIGNVD